MLGEHLPPLTLLCKDSLGNDVPMTEVPAGVTLALRAAPPLGQVAELAWEASEVDVDVSADMVSSAKSVCSSFCSSKCLFVCPRRLCCLLDQAFILSLYGVYLQDLATLLAPPDSPPVALHAGSRLEPTEISAACTNLEEKLQSKQCISACIVVVVLLQQKQESEQGLAILQDQA